MPLAFAAVSLAAPALCAALHAAPLAPFAAAPPAGAPGVPNGPPSLFETLMPSAGPAAQDVIEYPLAPRGWISAGAGFSTLDSDVQANEGPDEGTLIGGDVGMYSWRGELGLAIEAGFYRSSFDVVLDSLSSTKDSVTNERYLVGLRFADRGTSPSFLPWLRAGYQYRRDKGDLIEDSGSGFYVGGGIDWRLLSTPLALTPQVLYGSSDSFKAKEWAFTLQLTFQF